ncbi:MAG: nucleotidyltransferase domain-containing protein [Gemmatimonadetes bacterium]|nr:nucleotidyltransferase domain-containing protein [Gemmatimonadota bacterium]
MKAIPLPPITDEVIHQVRDRIVEAVHPEQIWLFGSAARGKTREGSDLDLLVVMDLPEGVSHYAQAAKIHSLFRDLLVPMDIIVMPPEEFARWHSTPGHIARIATRDGVLLHG